MLPMTYLLWSRFPLPYTAALQTDSLLFNRGALLNAAALVLNCSSYDYYVFQDVDTVPVAAHGLAYTFPKGPAPLHLTPFGIHPHANFEDFFGGILSISRLQFWLVNGFGAHFWGWGREDDNLRGRLELQGLWPPELPDLRSRTNAANGSSEFFFADPRRPYGDASIVSSQPALLRDYASGLNSTAFTYAEVSLDSWMGVRRMRVRLHCDRSQTPWCSVPAVPPPLRNARRKDLKDPLLG
ncbi:hypothetical protein QBZ16_000417 [Prototheca wickerhamii]|uniref:Galactosyltransferase C-terminal domain-containing protein n=1 Tax=Prototheca wickerhamii TaxID=3111 RepID=A0AAD9IMS0_PROWI|nr:hypothetical protein QBZ16_000417 [Prototheca wickerhamii]